MKNNNNAAVTQKSSCHKGHRQRLKQRFLVNKGIDFSDHELLEMLLYYCMPRVNTNELAHNLIDKFGSLRNALNADPEMVKMVHGIGDETAIFLSLIFAIRKRSDLEKYDLKRFKADSLSKVGNFLVDYYKDIPYEQVCVMLLDNSMRLIEFMPFSQGSVNTSSVDVKSLARYAMARNATRVILAHNHPSGSSVPSAYDRQVSVNLDAALRVLEIELIEHLIINDSSYTPTMHIRASEPDDPSKVAFYQSFYNN